ncbi:serine/threonine-protein kinase TAO1-A-like [Kryptolebias marmoratus]|uniref:serine/threonine-protein kinase TAO1-A-like n=1 Tax=Kryptolebias marmoratus TaxID=37003 RepID=UPI0007F9233D|nr:serine/threonine-protein kinase TAO1-A-like [Kryptolebias marmoratus]
MGTEQSKLTEEGYVISKETENYVIATKDNNSYFIKKIFLKELPKQTAAQLSSDIEILQKTNHPHFVNMKNSFKDEKEMVYYVVMDNCQGGNFADEIRKPESLEEAKVLSWIVEICMALKVIHEATLHHKNLTPKNILLTEFGKVCIAGSGNIHESSRSSSKAISNTVLNYLAPEVFSEGTYDAKSDIWSVGCILYELCTKEQAFSAKTVDKLIPKIIRGASPALPEDKFSLEFNSLLSDLLNKDPQERPTASEILAHPIVVRCLVTKSKTSMEELHTKLGQLRTLADGLERVHKGTTVGSLTGGVIGAVGGITSIVGLILSPFTLGASLIVTGVGVGVCALGGVTAGASNITKMVNQSSDRKSIDSIIKDFNQKINAVVTWLLEISSSLQTISQCPQTSEIDDSFRDEALKRLGCRAGKGLGGIAELIRLTRVLNIGKIAAQTSRAVRVAEVATGVLSGLFIAVDIFFIAMDAKEIHHIKQAREADHKGACSSNSNTETNDTVSSSDQTKLLSRSLMQESSTEEMSNAQDQSPPNKTVVRSEIMKFVRSVREAANNLEGVLNELKSIISSIPLFQEDGEWQNMELM